MFAFAAAAGANTVSVMIQQSRQVLTRRFGRRGWYVHLALTAPLWGVFVYLLSGLGRHVIWPLPASLRPAGVALLVVGAALWLAAFVQLGPERTANGFFFGRGPAEPVTSRLFARLRNPMYDSYALAFVGLACTRANGAYLLLALESYLLLNVVEASVENRPFEEGPP